MFCEDTRLQFDNLDPHLFQVVYLLSLSQPSTQPAPLYAYTLALSGLFFLSFSISSRYLFSPQLCFSLVGV